MALNPSNSSSLEQLALKGLIGSIRQVFLSHFLVSMLESFALSKSLKSFLCRPCASKSLYAHHPLVSQPDGHHFWSKICRVDGLIMASYVILWCTHGTALWKVTFRHFLTPIGLTICVQPFRWVSVSYRRPIMTLHVSSLILELSFCKSLSVHSCLSLAYVFISSTLCLKKVPTFKLSM